MKKQTGKLTTVILAMCLNIGLIGCGGTGEENAQQKNAHMEFAENRLYGVESVAPEGVEGDFGIYAVGRDRIYVDTIDDSVMTEQDWEDGNLNKRISRLYSFQYDGTKVKEIDLGRLSGNEIESMACGEDGSVVLFMYQRKDDGRGIADELLVRIDEEGNIINQQSIKDDLHEGYAMYRMIQDREGRVYICYMENFYLFNEDLTFAKEVKPKFTANSIGVTKDGRVICSGGDSREQFVCELDFESGDFGKRHMTGAQQVDLMETYIENDAYDFYYSNEYGCYGYNIEQELSTYLFDYDMSDMLCDDFFMMQALGDQKFIAEDWNSQNQFAVLSQEDMEEWENKTVITYGITDTFANNIKEMIVDFNRSNDEYRIELRDYSQEENPWLALNLDIVSGDVPDIIDLNGLPADQYIAKGLLEDLTPYFDKDLEIHTEDFIDSVMDAMRVDGRLYYIAPNFAVHSVIAKKEDVGDTEGITLSMVKGILERKGEKTKPFNAEGKVYMLFSFLEGGYSDFIDWSSGTCCFDSQEFKDILEICNRKSSDTEYAWGEGWGVPRLLREGIVLFVNIPVTCRELQVYRKLYDADITLVGYPGNSENGSYFSFQNRLGIYSQSQNKEAAWAFIRTLMTKEYQGKINLPQSAGSWYLPVRKDVFETYLQIETATEDFVDEFGKEWSKNHGMSGVDGVDVEIEAATSEDVKLLQDLIERTDKTVEANPAIDEIIEEEVKMYFAGFQSVDKTMEHIQKRVSTYVNESR